MIFPNYVHFEVTKVNKFQGWGFCHSSCELKDIFSSNLKKVQLTILDDKACAIMARQDKDNFADKQVFNKRNELCGGFINHINITIVNYTLANKKSSK